MQETTPKQERESIPFYPDHLSTELKVMGGILLLAAVVGIIGLFLPVGTGEPADPMNTPAHVKPEWYFLFLYQLLKFIPKTTGAVLPVIAMIVLTLWPFLDRKADSSKKARIYRGIAVAVILIAILALTIWGEVS
jgi:cytochrome b6-f complex subunit 4